MARTAVVNPRRKRRKLYGAAAAAHAKKRGGAKKRRRNPSAPSYALTNGRKRTRRRNPAQYALKNPSRRRRSNPAGGGYFDVDRMMGIIPAGVGGIQAARWAVKLAGPFETGAAGRGDRPGVKHGIAIALAAHFGGQMLGDLLGDPDKGAIAEIAALSWGGDLFLHRAFLDNSAPDSFVARNLYLGDANSDQQLGADDFIDATGNRYVRTPQGWQLAGIEMGAGFETDQPLPAGQIVTGPDGQLYQVAGDDDDGETAGIEMGTDRDLAADFAYGNFAGGSAGGYGY